MFPLDDILNKINHHKLKILIFIKCLRVREKDISTLSRYHRNERECSKLFYLHCTLRSIKSHFIWNICGKNYFSVAASTTRFECYDRSIANQYKLFVRKMNKKKNNEKETAGKVLSDNEHEYIAKGRHTRQHNRIDSFRYELLSISFIRTHHTTSAHALLHLYMCFGGRLGLCDLKVFDYFAYMWDSFHFVFEPPFTTPALSPFLTSSHRARASMKQVNSNKCRKFE